VVLVDSLLAENIITDLKQVNRWDVIKLLVGLLVKSGVIPESISEQVTKALIDREKSMSTGIGKGVAIPHCAIDQIDEARVAMAVIEKGINFESIDDEPVHVVVLLLSPKSKMQNHVKNLAGIAKFLSNDALKNAIISMKNTADIKNFIIEHAAHAR
jgi:mannitol/fructose-specific phosphotransferase system IIA component (Ntr-type)